MSLEMKSKTSIAAVAILMSGCATTKSTTTVQLEPGKTVEYNVPVALTGENPSMESLASTYTNSLARFTGYRAVSRQDNILTGVRVTSAKNAATISYIHRNDSGSLKNDYFAEFKIDATRNGDTSIIKVSCPSAISHDLSSLSALPWSPFISEEEVTQDVKGLCNKVVLSFTTSESGEVNTEYNDSSVFSNFSRKLKSYSPKAEEVKQYDLEKSKWFYITEGTKTYKVAVSVFPYRNGSKVVYKSSRTLNCIPNQGCPEFDAAFGQRLKSAIASIAND
jgi:hypothetical protein